MISHKQVVVIYGDSLLLEGISEALRRRGDLPVLVKTIVKPSTLVDLHPDLILVDSSQVTARMAEELLGAFSATRSPSIIRLNLDSQQLTITSTQQFPAASLADLEQMMDTISRPK